MALGHSRDITDVKQVETLRSLLVSSHFSVDVKRLHEVRMRMGEEMGEKTGEALGERRYETVNQESGRVNGS